MPVRRRTTGWLVALGLTGSISLLAQTDAPGALVQAQFAELLYADARFREAIDAYERAYAASAGDLRKAMGRGLVKSLLRSAEFKRARIAAAALVDEAPGDAEALALLGDTRWSAGQFDEAEAAYASALALQPEQARALSGVARGLDSRGRPDEALEYAQRAVSAGPGEPEFHHTLGFVLERQRRYTEAALAYAHYANLLPNKDHSDMAAWARQQVKLLKLVQAAAARGRAGHRSPVHTVPFKLRKDKIVVTGKVNGRAEMDFVLDTGSEMTVVSRRTAQRQGIAPIVSTLIAGVGAVGIRGLMIGTMDRFQVGTLVVDRVPTLIKNPPLQGLPTKEVESFSPMALGYSVHIDYERRVIVMARDLPPDRRRRRAAAARAPACDDVRGRVNGTTTVPFVIDTGGEVLSISRSTADAIGVVPPRHIKLRVYGTSGWDTGAFLLPGIDLGFGHIALDNHSVPVLNLDAPSVLLGFELGGILGHRFLSRYNVTLDLRRSVLRLAKHKAS